MNETILVAADDPVGLTVSITPWPLAGPADSTAIDGIESRVDGETLTLSASADAARAFTPLAQLRLLMEAALPILRTMERGKAKFSHSGIVLDAVQLAAALEAWVDDAVPIHSLIAFDFALRGDPPGTKSIGLATLVGQEVVAWPPDDSMRLVCARMVVRLAHDMLLHGPVVAERTFDAPEAPRGKVMLVPRDVPDPIVQIRF